MNKFNIRIILIAIPLIIFVAVFIFFLNEKVEVDKVPQEKIETQILTIEEEQALQQQIADIIKSENFDNCDSVKNDMYKKVCINNIALNLAEKTQDISYCHNIDNELVSISDCERQVILSKSIDVEDINICQETQNEELRKQCINNYWKILAVSKNDSTLCENYEGYVANSCLDNYFIEKEFNINQNEFVCDKLNIQENKDDCYSYKSLAKKGNQGFCAEMKTSLFYNICQNHLNFKNNEI